MPRPLRTDTDNREKKMIKRLTCALLCILTVTALAESTVHAGWVLYDNFSSGVINPAKWDVDSSSANITIENQKVKFVHKQGFPNDSSKLLFKISQPILGIRAKVYVVSAAGDLRARIGSYIGKTGKNEDVWQQIAVRQQYKNICGSVDAEDASGWLYDFFYTGFYNPNPTITPGNPILKKWFTMSVDFSNLPKITYSVTRQGTSTFKLPVQLLTRTDPLYYQIGTKSSDGSGFGTVYFDDVYILQ